MENVKNFEKTALSSNYSILFVNDHSTDSSSNYLKLFVKNNKNAQLINNKKNYGVGTSIQNIIEHGLKNNYDIVVIMAGNGKDDPLEIKKLINPILDNNYDYVQGSRFLKGGSFNNLPFARKLMIKGFTFLFYLFTGFHGSDASNGFRAYKLSIFNNQQIKLRQSWLNRYEFETYLHYKVLSLGYKVCEVGVSKNYLEGVKNYSKMKPFIDWWRMFRPLLYLKLRLKN